MKKSLLCFLALCIGVLAIAQNAPVDFEMSGNGADWTWTVFENETNPDLEIIDNPDAMGANTSATVAKFTALQAGEPFAGCETMHGSDIGTFTLNATTSTIRIMVWKSVISDVGIKLVEASAASLGEIKVANTVVNEWEELSFDFTDMIGIEYDQLVIFPDFDARDQDNVIYFDNVSFGTATPLAMPMEPAPDPTIDEADVISMYSGVYTDVPVDTWLTSWSQGNLADIDIMGNDTKQYSSLNFVGVETTADNLIDATEMEYFHVDVWSPNMTTFRVKLVDFGADGLFDGGDDTEGEVVFDGLEMETWHSLEIPLSDFEALGLAAREHMAQLIFSGLPVDAGVVYIDNVYYSKTATSLDVVEDQKLELFPNPTGGMLTLGGEGRIEAVRVFDMLGNVVLTPAVNGVVVDVAPLVSGAYVLRAVVGGVEVVERFIRL